MKADFIQSLQCPPCRGSSWKIRKDEEDEREIRSGILSCSSCGANYNIRNGVVDFLDPNDEALQREVKGWIEMHDSLGEHLVPTMAALPCYPHPPWPHVAPDFFQIFEHVSFEGRRVVDIGAGRAWSSRYLSTIGRAREVVAIDVLTTRFLGLETADIYFREDSIFFERIRGDAHHIPLRDGWADAVFGVGVLHHSSDLPALFGEVWRVLRPGGQFIFLCEPCKKASIPWRQPQNAEVAHGINENVYSLSEYVQPLGNVGFTYRRLVPRTIRYRLLYPDSDFQDIPRLIRPFTRSERGRNLIELMLRNRWLGALLYQNWNLPLTLVATKPP